MTTLRELGALLAEGVPTPRPDPRQPRMERRDYGYPPVKTLPETDEERRKRLGYSAASPQFFEQPTTLANLGDTLGDPFALAVRGDLQKQFPGDTPEQIEQRVAAVVAAMAPPAMRNAYRPEVQGGLRVNPENWAAFLAAQPRSTNIIDLRGQPPAQLRPGERLNTSTPLYRR